MQKEFGEELGLQEPKDIWGKAKKFLKKAVSEEIRQIFTEIVKEERTDRIQMIREQERLNLGRAKK